MPKRALLAVSAEVLGDIPRLLTGAGIRIVGSDANPVPETVGLLIEGDALPIECARGRIRQVRASLKSIGPAVWIDSFQLA